MRFRVRELAEAQGYSIRALAKAAGLSYETVLLIWHNRNPWPNSKTLEKLAHALNTTPHELIAPEDR